MKFFLNEIHIALFSIKFLGGALALDPCPRDQSISKQQCNKTSNTTKVP